MTGGREIQLGKRLGQGFDWTSLVRAVIILVVSASKSFFSYPENRKHLAIKSANQGEFHLTLFSLAKVKYKSQYKQFLNNRC